MTLRKTLTLTLSLFFSISVFSQVTLSGKLTDAGSGEGLISATVRVGDTGTTTDFDGNYTIDLPAGKYTVEATYLGYETQTKTIELIEDQTLDFQLGESATLLNTATVTSGKFEKPLSEVTVSLEVVKPQLLENTNSTSVDDVLKKVPGVEIIDGQANIRGGSGWSYGAGSRVMLLMDDIPILQADAGLANWNDLPVENIEQIEVVKGAGSALYGSAAMNGIINVRTAYAKSEPVTKVSTFYTYFDDISDESQIWYDEQPREFGVSLSHKQKFEKLDLVAGGYYLNSNSFRQERYDRYGRVNTNLRYRYSDKLVFGVNANFNRANNSDYFYWAGLDSLYSPAPATITKGERLRYNVDPFITYFDNSGNRHRFLGRFHSTNNDNNNDQSNSSQLLYSEYQFQRQFENGLVATAGAVRIGNSVNAQLYGDTTFRTRNLAAYAQLEKKFFDRLNVSAGFRFENNRLIAPEISGCDTAFLTEIVTCDTIPNGEIIESRPVFRFGANYQAAKFTFIRASWGEGYRFPTLAEQFIQTETGGVVIGSNPELQSESGWSSEIGIKQGFRVGGFDGFLDVSGFWSQYNDMIEFNLTKFFPVATFQAINVGGTDIKGLEATVAGQGDLFGLPTSVLAGYIYLQPQFQEFDATTPAAGVEATEGQGNYLGSTLDENFLKYRTKHSAKIDIEFSPKVFSFGFSANYNSQIEAIDRIFETFNVIPGIAEYRDNNASGNLVLTARASVKFYKEQGKFSIVANNLTNEMYSIRPGIMEAPRSITGRLDWKF